MSGQERGEDDRTHPQPLYKERRVSGAKGDNNVARTAHKHPPEGQAGIAAGTSYVVNRFHGVLRNTRLNKYCI